MMIGRTLFPVHLTVEGLTGEQLRSAAARARPALVGAMTETMNQIRAFAARNLAPHMRTGRLIHSIGPPRVWATGRFVFGTVRTRLKYAAITEFGGTIPEHVVRPRRRSALRFIGSDGQNFAGAVTIPKQRRSPHPFLRPAAETAMPAAEARFLNAFMSAFDESGGSA